MPSVQDWAARAASRIDDEYPMKASGYRARPSEARIAAIIATFAAPILKLLNETRRSHSNGWNEEVCDSKPCPKSKEDEYLTGDEKCTCSADAWNARIDEALR